MGVDAAVFVVLVLLALAIPSRNRRRASRRRNNDLAIQDMATLDEFRADVDHGKAGWE